MYVDIVMSNAFNLNNFSFLFLTKLEMKVLVKM